MTAGTLREAFQEVTPDNAGQALFTRCERETLVRFPQTKAILFTIRTYIRNLAWYAARPDECATLAEALRNLPEDLVSFFALVPLLQCLSASTCHLPACLCLAVILYCKINEVPHLPCSCACGGECSTVCSYIAYVWALSCSAIDFVCIICLLPAAKGARWDL